MEPIRSVRNRMVVEAGRLHGARYRKSSHRTLIEGPHLVTEAMAAGVAIERTFVPDDDPQSQQWPSPVLVDERVMARIAGTETPRGPVSVIAIPGWDPVPAGRHLLVLWEVGDPGNVGTMIRTAAAFGLGIVIAPGTADPWSPKVLRAGAGGHFRTTISSIRTVADLPDHRLAATVVDGGVDPASLGDGPWALLMGSEPHGLAAELIGAADQLVTIPMPGGVESLNAAVAAAILAYVVTTGSGRPHTSN